MNFKDKLELQYVKLHFFNQLGICSIVYLLADRSIPKQSLFSYHFFGFCPLFAITNLAAFGDFPKFQR